MIGVTRLDGGSLIVNADLIVTIEQTPDTALALANGDKLFVREAPDLLIERIIEYRRRVAAGPASASSEPNGHGA